MKMWQFRNGWIIRSHNVGTELVQDTKNIDLHTEMVRVENRKYTVQKL